jgi:hypothetical protein
LNEEPEKTYSGKFVLRVPTNLHAQLDLCARLEKKSLNECAKGMLEKAVQSKLDNYGSNMMENESKRLTGAFKVSFGKKDIEPNFEQSKNVIKLPQVGKIELGKAS